MLLNSLIQTAVVRLQSLSSVYNPDEYTVILIDAPMLGRPAGYYGIAAKSPGVFLTRWLGATVMDAADSLNLEADMIMEVLKSGSGTGRIAMQNEVTRAEQGFADSIRRFDTVIAPLLGVSSLKNARVALEAKPDRSDFGAAIAKALGVAFDPDGDDDDDDDEDDGNSMLKLMSRLGLGGFVMDNQHNSDPRANYTNAARQSFGGD